MHQVRDIAEHGCGSGVYMPAVEYATAAQTMHKHSHGILDMVEDFGIIKWDVSKMSWDGLAMHMVSFAVEVWARQWVDILAKIESEMPDNEEVNNG